MPYPPLPPAPCGLLPAQLRVLSVTGDAAGSWSSEALAADSAMDITLVHAPGGACALKLLGEAKFDAVIVSHAPPLIDALQVLDAILAGHGNDVPILIAGHASELLMAAVCFEAGAEAYLCLPQTSTRALFWHLARAVERHRLMAENRQYAAAQRQRLANENQEAGRLLSKQRQLIDGLESIAAHPEAGVSKNENTVPKEADVNLSQQYQQLLQRSVIAGIESVAEEVITLAARLSTTGTSGAGAMKLHLQVLGELLEGLGPRSARQVIQCGDQLILQLMTHLASNYGGKFRRGGEFHRGGHTGEAA